MTHKFTFFNTSKAMLWKMKKKENQVFEDIVVLRILITQLSLNNDITKNSISFDDNLLDQAILLSTVCWDVTRILLKVGTSSRLTCQLDRVVCWPELTGLPGGLARLGVDISPPDLPQPALLPISAATSICATHLFFKYNAVFCACILCIIRIFRRILYIAQSCKKTDFADANMFFFSGCTMRHFFCS